MAVIQYSGIVTQLRGSIAGTTFSKTKTGYSAYKKGLPRQQKSSAQNAVNAGFAANANLWRTLDSAQKANWATLAAAIQVYNRIGELVNISPYNMYQLVSGLINPAGSETALNCDATTDPPYQFSIVLNSIEFASTSLGWQISQVDIDITTITNQATNCIVVFYISQPEISADTITGTEWYRLAEDSIPGNVGTSETENFSFSDIQLPKGFRVSPGMFYRVKAVMIQVNSKVISPGIFSPPTEATEFTFPWPTLNMADKFSGSSLEISGSNITSFLFSYFSVSPSTSDKEDYKLEFAYRGNRGNADPIVYTTNDPLGEWDFQPGGSGTAWEFPKYTDRATIMPIMNSVMAPITFPPFTQAGIFTARLKYIPLNIYSPEFQFLWDYTEG